MTDGRPQVSVFRPAFRRLFYLVVYGPNMSRRRSPRVEAWLFRHWPGTRTPWEPVPSSLPGGQMVADVLRALGSEDVEERLSE